uniref:Uncharacterized protein n=1 Tax=Tolypothrix bouteillei VB521301 TaxID=1479485 RepID=A0A0C1N583_9CYAN
MLHLAFINKLDRLGANSFHVVDALREKLGLNAVVLQYSIGLEGKFEKVKFGKMQIAQITFNKYLNITKTSQTTAIS